MPTYIIRVKDFISLAEYIAGKMKAPASVPASFRLALHRAISARREHGAHLPSSQMAQALSFENNDADEGHGYFIGVLEHVRDVLRPRMLDALRMEEARPDVTERLVNRFEKLEVEEPSEAFLQAPDGAAATAQEKTATTTTQPDARYEAERVDDLEETGLAFRLLLQDLNRIRSFLTQTWDGYRQGMFGLVPCSLVTNAAIDLARSLEEEIKTNLDRYGGAGKFIDAYYVALCLERKQHPNFKERLGDAMNFNVYEEAENFFFPAFQLLEAFAKLVDSRHIPEYRRATMACTIRRVIGRRSPLGTSSRRTNRF